MSIFTSRDIALAVWTALFVAWAAANRDIRRSVGGVVRAASHWRLVVLFAMLVAYTAGMVRVLHAIGFWQRDLLKDTIIWFLFSGVALGFSGVHSGSAPRIWSRVLRDQLKAVFFVEYIVNTYTFALWIELLIVPFLAFVALLDAMAQSDSKYSAVARLTGVLQGLFGITVIACAVCQAVARRDSLNVVGVFREISLAPLFSILLLPIVYAFFLLSAYERLFLILNMGSKKDADLAWYASRKLIMHLGIRPESVRAFTRGNIFGLRNATTRADVDKLIELNLDETSGDRSEGG